MEKMQAWMEKHMLPLANKIAHQKYLRSISAGMVAMMPVSIVSSLALILMSPPMASAEMDPGFLQSFMAGWESMASFLFFPLNAIYTAANTLSAIIATLGIAWSLANHYNMQEKEGIIPTSLAVICFLIVGGIGIDGTFTIANLGGTGYFTAIVVALVCVEAYRFLIKKNVGIIDMSGYGVPAFITASFRGIVPCTLILIPLVLLDWAVVVNLGITVPEITSWIMSPLVSVIDSPFAVAFLGALVGLFWWFGIHDTCITSPLGILWTPIGLANAAAHVAGTELPYIVTSGFWWTFMAIGGSGATFALCLLLITSKSKQLKTVGRLGIIPGFFNINEPVIFGLPIMLNPMMIIPFTLALPLNGLITYFAMATGLVEKMFTAASWNMFAPIAAFIGTMDWKATVLAVVLIIIDMLLYYPFFKAMERQKVKEEHEQAQTESK